MAEEPKLSPCPFCGGEARLEVSASPGQDWGNSNPISRVYCAHCLIRTPWENIFDETIKLKSVDLWNTRTEPQQGE